VAAARARLPAVHFPEIPSPALEIENQRRKATTGRSPPASSRRSWPTSKATSTNERMEAWGGS